MYLDLVRQWKKEVVAMAEKEFIEREALLKSDNWQSLTSDFDKARAHIIILGQPAADVVEVVRCKECIFAEANGGDCNSTLPITYRNYVCEINETKYITLDFCSYGERREDNA